MRIILFIGVLAAIWYGLARRDDGLLRGPMAAVGSAASASWAAIPWPGREAEHALAAERERSARLDESLVELRGELRQAAAEADARGKAADDAQQQVASRDGDLQAEHARVGALTDQVAALKREVTAQADAWREQVGKEKADAQASRHDGDVARERLDQANARLAAADAARSSLQEQLQAQAKAALDEQERSKALTQRLDQLQHDADGRVSALQAQLSEAQGRLAGTFEAERATGGEDQGGAHPSAPGPAPQLPDRAGAGPGRYRLADAAPTRVVVRYAPASASAKAHAISLCGKLQAQGVMIEQLIEAPAPMQASSVGFFYGNDESRAAGIATLFPELRSNVHQRPVTEAIPRPGLIEIEIAT